MIGQWWQRGVIYQIYPRSFQDCDGDGVGDITGIISRLDYLATLGVDALWLSPIFPSPMADFGYDVADYCNIDPLFGDLAAFDRLCAAAHLRGMKIILDFVPNHSSEQHPWFEDSRSSRESAKRDWYIWHDPADDGGAPNNWISDFGGAAWEFDPATGQYYSHAFLKEQPDLNWRDPGLRDAMLDVLRFWFDRGVDGFRIDVLWHMIKAADFADNPVNPEYAPEMGEMYRLVQLNSTDQPEVHEIARDMRQIADSYDERVLIGEIYLPVEKLMMYYGTNAPEVHMPFNFQLIEAPWNARILERLIADYEAALPPDAWPNWVLGNHDRPRVAARIGEDQARVAAMLLLTLRGTPTLYYGDELGMGDVEIPIDSVKDPRELREPGLGLGRDPVRSPMPWQGDAPNAGFSPAEPWLPLNADWRGRNAATLDQDSASILSLYRHLLAFRRGNEALSMGEIRLLKAEGDILAYERCTATQRLAIVLNLGAEPQDFEMPSDVRSLTPLISTLQHLPPAITDTLVLAPHEGLILDIMGG